MELSSLVAISPIDGRYRKQTEALAPFFSEQGLMRYRILVEVEYFIALCELPLPQLAHFDRQLFEPLRNIYRFFSTEDAKKIKELEKITNHDVKAVEYFLKSHFERLQIARYQEFVHFGLTSQDVNNTAIPLSLKEAITSIYLPMLQAVIGKLTCLAAQWANVPMLAFTHGQPASPTRMGKEIRVFVYRLEEQLKTLLAVPYSAKFGGATGNMNAHYVAYPTIDWRNFANQFVNQRLGLQRAQWTTQIENYDHLAALFDALRRINTILIDFARDMWTYISIGYFKQKAVAHEVGSSAMPHKVNPIDFENAEGNLGYANAIFGFLAEKLPISRLQRDLTDSTVLRNIGVPIAHTLVALHSLQKGLNKIDLNESRLYADLNDNWAVVAEALQSILRREGYPQPYETLKALTRGQEGITQQRIAEFIASLQVPEAVKAEMLAISPFNYTGV
ncbi:MAG: adenylosuccinate lyase [Cytophagales bacterium]|nr:adenylosuccinate lyase [Bernardetiaceae bacterium]MDW8205133.1 adenylosuccinate lyase [Cytophagales bacterium]